MICWTRRIKNTTKQDGVWAGLLQETVQKGTVAQRFGEINFKINNICIQARYRKSHSINKNLYSAPSRSLLRDARDPGQAEKISLEKVVELRTGTVWKVPQFLRHLSGCRSITMVSGVNLLWEVGGRESGFENWGSWVLKVQQTVAGITGFRVSSPEYLCRYFWKVITLESVLVSYFYTLEHIIIFHGDPKTLIPKSWDRDPQFLRIDAYDYGLKNECNAFLSNITRQSKHVTIMVGKFIEERQVLAKLIIKYSIDSLDKCGVSTSAQTMSSNGSVTYFVPFLLVVITSLKKLCCSLRSLTSRSEIFLNFAAYLSRLLYI